MNTEKGKKVSDFSMTIAPSDGHTLTNDEKNLIREHAKVRQANRSPERIVRNQMLSVLYRLEEYLQEEDSKSREIYTIEYFVNEFIKILNLNKSQFANHLDTDVSNLNKYLKGQRAFNTELTMKFSRFFHTPVDIWLKVQLKNDLIALQEANKGHKYDKYDYKKVLQMT
ncbi:MAG: transcriptional regulator [Chryseobacterium sp.]|nr:MAG: transcriptional regulator [Chryseobacterium sp.]